MNNERLRQKDLGVEALKKLKIYKPYIKQFNKPEHAKDIVVFERFAGFYVYLNDYKELANKITEIEEKYNCTVYAITHEMTQFGELYDFLIVGTGTNDINDIVIDLTIKNTDDMDAFDIASSNFSHDKFIVFAYIWNKTHPEFSELGDIIVESQAGGLRRTA